MVKVNNIPCFHLTFRPRHHLKTMQAYKSLIHVLLSFTLFGLIACKSEAPVPEEDQDSAEAYFPPLIGTQWERLAPESLNWCAPRMEELQSFLAQTGTRAFLILKNGRIVTEWYFQGHTATTPHFWNSAGKTVTAFLIGQAQEQGALDIQNPSATYLGSGWSSLTPEQEAQIKVWHQLTMTTGLDYQVNNLSCTSADCLHYGAAPGSSWFYHNAPYTLLTNVIENATGMGINQYGNQMLYSRIGMDGGYVSIGFNRVFRSTARAMARFGLLIQQRGVWDGQAIMEDQAYLQAMISPSQSLNPAYGYLWWLNGQDRFLLPGLTMAIPGNMMPDAPKDIIAGIGLNDQNVFVWPSEGMVVVRMGENASMPRAAGGFENELWKRILKLGQCP